MEVIKTKKQGYYILNILNNDGKFDLLGSDICKLYDMLNSIKSKSARIALDLRNIDSISSFEFLNFIKGKNINLLTNNPNHLAWLSLVNEGVLPPVYLCEKDFSEKRRRFVKRNFFVV